MVDKIDLSSMEHVVAKFSRRIAESECGECGWRRAGESD